ncbi:hypothetical protein ACCAA_290011 [Candidatus Accumulibacter aalborgensis]|uniref:Electron transport complex subunit RsxE n=1 Tax=Candidatus Accumulibacter aalborgensis TaxID=1860102 RepID=A0A1A8XPX7_9PROT|nr:Rnf-Nqr domain containing protein [Candidatus Accumulibacter aalborgensis]SBT05993.1 hypothetical protein ACCAA_290011 [Candidatus Accumulibacter aalborgensis]
MSDNYGNIIRQGLWSENIVFSQLLAMCPTMAVTTSGTNGLGMGLGFTGALTLIGLIREFLGAGTLFAQASNLLGPSFAFLEMKLPGYGGALLMILPPGGFAILGFLLAGKRVMESRLAQGSWQAAGAATVTT